MISKLATLWCLYLNVVVVVVFAETRKELKVVFLFVVLSLFHIIIIIKSVSIPSPIRAEYEMRPNSGMLFAYFAVASDLFVCFVLFCSSVAQSSVTSTSV